MDSNQFFSKYDTLTEESLKKYHVPGASIAVVDGDSTWMKVHIFHVSDLYWIVKHLYRDMALPDIPMRRSQLQQYSMLEA